MALASCCKLALLLHFFSFALPVPSQCPPCSKPRFFNRVKTGFEWNKYNQTHYDKENPPPKIVQGYK